MGILPRSSWIAVAFAILAGCETGTSDKDIRIVSVADVRELAEERERRETAAAFIDPRSAARFAAAHIPGAMHMELPDASLEAPPRPTLKRYDVLVVYGDDPADALAKGMAKRLIRQKYRRVLWFAGGLQEWREGGGTIEAAADAAPEAPPGGVPGPEGNGGG